LGLFATACSGLTLWKSYEEQPEQWDDVPDPHPHTGVSSLADRMFVTVGRMAAVQTEERSALLDLLRSQMLKAPRPKTVSKRLNIMRESLGLEG